MVLGDSSPESAIRGVPTAVLDGPSGPGSVVVFELPTAGDRGRAATAPVALGGDRTPPCRAADESSPPPSAAVWRPDEFVQDPGYLAYQEELRCLLFTTAQQTAAATREGTPAPPPPPLPPGEPGRVVLPDGRGNCLSAGGGGDGEGGGDQSAVRRETAAILAQGRRMEYLQNYVAVVAPWLDMFDGRRTFGLRLPVLARTSPALLYAMLALSARQMERVDDRQEQQPRHQRGEGGGEEEREEQEDQEEEEDDDDEVEGTADLSLPRSWSSGRSMRRRRTKRRRQRRLRRRGDSFDSLELYQEAIRRLTPLLQVRDPNILPICTVLCVMEMMSASAHDWRKHLQGCAALFDVLGVHGFSGGLLQAVFWCYARMDLCGALISDGVQSTLVPPAKWLGPDADPANARELFRRAASPDMHANYAVYLCAQACDLTAARTRFTELGEANGCDSDAFAGRWLALWEDLQAWVRDRPTELLPVKTVEGSPFPHILYVHWAAVSSNQLYHTACVLLLGVMPRRLNFEMLGSVGSCAWHVKRICGISLTNPHQGCLNNAIQPLWIAGRLLTHESEHALVVKLIWNIEATTGWGTRWRIPDLETAWGYRVQMDN